jgi:hypothetical protein
MVASYRQGIGRTGSETTIDKITIKEIFLKVIIVLKEIKTNRVWNRTMIQIRWIKCTGVVVITTLIIIISEIMALR